MSASGMVFQFRPPNSDVFTIHVRAVEAEEDERILHHLLHFKGYHKLFVSVWYLIRRKCFKRLVCRCRNDYERLG
jgi:hypothetical protein